MAGSPNTNGCRSKPISWNPNLRGGWRPTRTGILEDGRVLIIGRQVPTDLGAPLTYVAVVELKRANRMPREVVEEIRPAPSPCAISWRSCDSSLHELWPELAL